MTAASAADVPHLSSLQNKSLLPLLKLFKHPFQDCPDGAPLPIDMKSSKSWIEEEWAGSTKYSIGKSNRKWL